jgi:hypothetical protein
MATPPLQAPFSQRSLAEEITAEWRTRKVRTFDVVSGVLSQIKPGVDFSRISMPASLLLPYSMLEVLALRELSFFEVLLPALGENDPLGRMLLVCQWYLAGLQPEDIQRKPYNPILGETHFAWIESEVWGRSACLLEQVSHHPPISACVLRNPKADITLYVTTAFSVASHTLLAVDGAALLVFGKTQEKYALSRRLPDSKITSGILQARRMYWTGEVVLECEQTGLACTFSFKEKSDTNLVHAVIRSGPKDLLALEGNLASTITVGPPGGPVKPLIELSSVPRNRVEYPPVSALDEWSSQVVWAQANRHIVAGSPDPAEKAKQEIEVSQRARATGQAASGKAYQPRFFQLKSGAKLWMLGEPGLLKLSQVCSFSLCRCVSDVLTWQAGLRRKLSKPRAGSGA